MHWCLLVVDMTNGSVELWDSLRSGQTIPSQIDQKRLASFLSTFSPSTPKLKFSVVDVPQQTGTNCGVFMLEFIRAFVKGEHDGRCVNVTEAQMPTFRAEIVKQLQEQEQAAPPIKKRRPGKCE
jgi:Ulp1 family protease